jgi:hypothetical protein
MNLKDQMKSLRLMESRRNSQNHPKKRRKDHPKLLPIVIKVGGSANSQRMTRQQIGFETHKLYKVQA